MFPSQTFECGALSACVQGICSKTPTGCPKPWIVPKPVIGRFFSIYPYILMITFNLLIRHSRKLTVTTTNKIEQF